jgi:hypothetical protein
VLPLDILSFQGKTIGVNKAQLQWMVLDQEVGTVYELQSSSDARTFNTIYKKVATQQLSSAEHDYIDELLASRTFYRIKYYEPNGEIRYTKIIQVSAQGAGHLVLTPNPTSGKVNIVLPEEPADKLWVKVFDIAGKEVLEKELQITDRSFDVVLPEIPGTYLLQVTTENKRYVSRVVVE